MLDKEGLNGEISVGVTFASLMAAVALFFTGILIGQFQSFGSTIEVPLLFLIISTFSFIFAATIYNNAGTEITLGKLKTVEKYMIYAKNIVEFLGLYLLILSIPLVIGAVTGDNFLRLSTTFVALAGIALYSQSKFSVLEKQLPGRQKRLYSIFVVALALILYISQTAEWSSTIFSYNVMAVILIVSLLLPTIFFSLKSQQYRITFIRGFRDGDAPALSEIIRKNVQRAKHSNQPKHLVEAMEASSSESAIRNLAYDKQVFVAVFGNKPVGVAGLEGNTLLAIFTDPDLQRKGVGRMLVDAAEVAASEQGYDHMEVRAVASNQKFYKKLGYDHVRKDGDMFIMQKEL